MTSTSVLAQDWFQIETGTDKKLNTIEFPTANVGYIGGNDSLLLKSTDYGETWNPVNYSGVTFFPGSEHILNLKFVTNNIGFMTVGPYNGMYKTTDGGSTWTQITGLSTCFNQGMYFFDENNGFVGGSGCFQGEIIDRLSSGTWSQSTINSSTWDAMNYITDIDFLNSMDGLAASRSGYILRTDDGGITWDTVPTPDLLNPVTSVLYVSPTLAYAGYETVSTGFGLYISTDGGLTWEQDMESATFLYPDFFCLHQSGDGKIYSGGYTPTGDQGVIFQNPGQWSSWETFALDQTINSIDSYYDSIVFAVGDSGYLVVNQPLDLLSIEEQMNESVSFELFPNPANSILNIVDEKQIINENAEINIYSLTGKLMANQKFTKTIDVSDLQTGCYIIEVSSEKNTYRKKFLKE